MYYIYPFQLFIRFGTVKTLSADEEAKKKARLARFGSATVTDSAEEDKKKARALRYTNRVDIFLFLYSRVGNVDTLNVFITEHSAYHCEILKELKIFE